MWEILGRKKQFLSFSAGASAYAFVLSALVLSVPAAAHNGRGVNGGQLVDSGTNHVEFVGGPGNELLFFSVTDGNQKPLVNEVRSAAALVDMDGKKVRIPLRTAGGGVLSAENGMMIKAGALIQFFAQLANGENVQAKFAYR